MSSHAALQSMVRTQCKAESSKTIDSSGILYEKVGEQDMGRYHVLDSTGLIKEREDIRELQNQLLEVKKRREKNTSRSIRVGETHGSKKKDTSSTFEDVLRTGKIEQLRPEDRDLAEGIIENSQLYVDENIPDYARNATHLGSWSQYYNKNAQEEYAPKNSVNFVMETVKAKFHQNLDVIDHLHAENQKLKDKVSELEEEVIDTRTASHGGIIYTQPKNRRRDNDEGRPQSAAATFDRLSKPKPKDYKDEREKVEREKEKQTKFISADDMAGIMDDRIIRKARGEDPDKPTNTVISKGIPKTLLASVDKYNMRQKAFEHSEKEKRLEQQQYLEELAERKKRAAHGPKIPFRGLEERAAASKAKTYEKMKEIKKEGEAALDDKRREFVENLSKHVADYEKNHDVAEVSYAAMQEQEETERRERIERRKNELLFASKAPIDIEPKNRGIEGLAETYQYTAKDPDAVMEKLEYNALRWQNHLETTREKIKAQEREQRAFQNQSEINPADNMKKRASFLEIKRQQRIREQEKKKAEREKKLLEKEKKEMMKVIDHKVPEAGRRLTKAAENRLKMTQEKLNARRAKEEAEKERRQRLSIKHKAFSADLKASVQAWNDRRKQEHGNFKDLEISEDAAGAKAHASHLNFKKRLHENKARINDVQKTAPSLIERHDQRIEQDKAFNRTLLIAAGIIHETDEANRQEILEKKREKERMRKAKENDRNAAASKETKTRYESKESEEDYFQAKESWNAEKEIDAQRKQKIADEKIYTSYLEDLMPEVEYA
jgi:hypothetical protein